ncbi:MAG: four helix bundle protein [Dinghuibacter sp.]|nr:four helix bundle protein [Dinghuibacter sp.]
MATFKTLEEIIVWQKARAFCKEVKKDAPLYIALKEFSLLNQLKDSSGSCMDNIAEGFGRMGNAEFKNFLSIAHGSILESVSQLYRSFDYEVIQEERFLYMKEKAYEIARMLESLVGHLLNSDLKGIKYVRK